MFKKIIRILLPDLIKNYLLNKIWKTDGKFFCYLYNVFSIFLFKNKNFVIYDGTKYILNEDRIFFDVFKCPISRQHC